MASASPQPIVAYDIQRAPYWRADRNFQHAACDLQAVAPGTSQALKGHCSGATALAAEAVLDDRLAWPCYAGNDDELFDQLRAADVEAGGMHRISPWPQTSAFSVELHRLLHMLSSCTRLRR